MRSSLVWALFCLLIVSSSGSMQINSIEANESHLNADNQPNQEQGSDRDETVRLDYQLAPMYHEYPSRYTQLSPQMRGDKIRGALRQFLYTQMSLPTGLEQPQRTRLQARSVSANPAPMNRWLEPADGKGQEREQRKDEEALQVAQELPPYSGASGHKEYRNTNAPVYMRQPPRFGKRTIFDAFF